MTSYAYSWVPDLSICPRNAPVLLPSVPEVPQCDGHGWGTIGVMSLQMDTLVFARTPSYLTGAKRREWMGGWGLLG